MNKQLSAGDPRPLYVQVAEDLRAQFTAGVQLPGTAELTARYETGHMTVRRAIGLLRDEGVVITTPGRGTFYASELRTSPEPIEDAAEQVSGIVKQINTLVRQLAKMAQDGRSESTDQQ